MLRDLLQLAAYLAVVLAVIAAIYTVVAGMRARQAQKKRGGISAPVDIVLVLLSGGADGITGGACGILESLARALDWNHALHSAVDRVHRALTGVISNRPMFAQPILSLFDCRDLLCVTAIGDDECQGFSPAYFYHRTHMGIEPRKSKAVCHD